MVSIQHLMSVVLPTDLGSVGISQIAKNTIHVEVSSAAVQELMNKINFTF